MRWLKRLPVWLKWTLGFAMAAALACAAWWGAMLYTVGTADWCGYELKSTVISPDGRYKAGVVEANCGATTDYASWFVLTDARKPFDYEKDRLAAVETQVMKIEWEGPKLVVRWRADLPSKLAAKQPAFVEYRPL